MISGFLTLQATRGCPLHLVCILSYCTVAISSNGAAKVNYPEPNKRPLSSCVPTIVEHANGSLYLTVGGAGGLRIFPSVFQVMLNIEWGQDVSAAIEFGRLHDQLYPMEVVADSTYPQDILTSLTKKGHNITSKTCFDLYIGPYLLPKSEPVLDIGRDAASVQAVMQHDGKLFGTLSCLFPSPFCLTSISCK